MIRRICNVLAIVTVLVGAMVAAPSLASAETRILALGDSLTAGLGLGPGDTFPERLQTALRTAGHDVSVTNAGVSGDTSAGGKDRLDWLIGGEQAPGVLILELGANDGLRAIDPKTTEANLAAIIEDARAKGIVVLLTGMYAPPNLGTEYGSAFDAIYPALAKKYDVIYYPFFLNGVAGDVTLNQADGIHPTPEGVKIIVHNMLPTVIEAIEKAG